MDGNTVSREEWRGMVMESIQAGDYEKALRLLAQNHRDGGDIALFVENTISEADYLGKEKSPR